MTDMDIVSLSEDDTEFQSQSSVQTPVYKTDLRNGRNPDSGPRRMVDITRDKPIKVTIRVVVPVRDHPKFNFVGKLLGPKGNSLKRLQEETMTKMAILGRGSMRDRHKEEELRGSGDPKFSHLLEELHVEVTAFAPPAEAHARIAYALAEVRRFLVPDYNDDIRQEQMWEMAALRGVASSSASSEGPESTGTEDSEPASRAGGRKRPLGIAQRMSMSPTKRTVLSILARARTAQAADPTPFGVSSIGNHNPLPERIKKTMAQCHSEGKRVYLKWVKANSGDPGNEIADREAKSAANEESVTVTYNKVPVSKIKYLLKNISQLKWNEQWTELQTGRHLYDFIH